MQGLERQRLLAMSSSSVQQLLAFDESLSARIAEFGAEGFSRAVAWLLARSGDSLFWLAVSAILIWRQSPLGWTLLITVAVTALLTGLAKGIFRRKRPTEKWAIATDKYAFPSGHAARAGAIAVALSFAFPPWTAFWLLWAVLVALARVALSRHYLSDVIAGLIFGILVSLLLQLLVF
jgi:undecaprenyl-diphosphatase